MKRPAFQFYPADWRKDANLRRCSPAARGVWMDVLCVLHDSDEYGIVRWPLKELASAAGASIAHLKELAEKRVIKGGDKGAVEALIYTPRHGRRDGEPVTLIPAQDGPLWFSARFVRDEYVRTVRGESSRFGADKGDAPKDAPKPPFGDGSSTSSSSSPSGNSSDAYASGGKPPMSPEEIIFTYGVPLLVNAGSSEKHARSFLGGLRKGRDDTQVVDALRDCIRAKTLQPLEWLAAALPPAGSPKSKAKANAAQSFAAQDREAGMARWEQMTGQVHPDRASGSVIDITPVAPAPLRIEA